MNWRNGKLVLDFPLGPAVVDYSECIAGAAYLLKSMRDAAGLVEGDEVKFRFDDGALIIATPEKAAAINNVFERDALLAAITGCEEDQDKLIGCRIILRAPGHTDLDGIIQPRFINGTVYVDDGDETQFTPVDIKQLFSAKFLWCSLGKEPGEEPPTFE